MAKIFAVIRNYWKSRKTFDRFIIIISLLYLGLIGIFLLIHWAPYAPDQFYVLAFIFVLIIGQARKFIRDWTPPILLILAYEYLRGLIPLLNSHVYYQPMIKFDEFIFGGLPTDFLQKLLFTATHLHWYDYASVILYSLHYFIPLLVAFVFWMTDRKFFENYIFAMVGMSFVGFAIYLIFPAAPPWLASEMHILNPPVKHITNFVIDKFPKAASLPTVYSFFRANAVAAVPSLHAAYVFMTSLFVVKKKSKLWPLMTFYTLGVWFAVVYLGEHYVFDVFSGAILALLVFLVVLNWERVTSFIFSKKPIL